VSHFAHIIDGIVDQVIVVEQDQIDSGAFGPPSEWVQTSYNTYGGVHYAPDSSYTIPDGGEAVRANYAGVGYTYDPTHDVFYAPQPYPSWVISGPSWLWQAPVPYPSDGNVYDWDETTTSWVFVWGEGTLTSQASAIIGASVSSDASATISQ
jgi:hypothetical protein